MPIVIAVWGPGGNNTAQFSLHLATELARHKKVMLAELPCLGIPRLGFAAGIMDRDNHTEAAIIELAKKAELSLDQLHKQQEMLALLPASVFAVPDYPVTLKVELETLVDFPASLIQKAAKLGYEIVVLECQGQLTSPMTFFAVKLADTVIIPVKEPQEIAFSLINIKRLIQMFKYLPEKFKVVSTANTEDLAEVMVIKDEEGRTTARIDVLYEDPEGLAASFCNNYETNGEKTLDNPTGKKGQVFTILSGAVSTIRKSMAGQWAMKGSLAPKHDEIRKVRL